MRLFNDNHDKVHDSAADPVCSWIGPFLPPLIFWMSELVQFADNRSCLRELFEHAVRLEFAYDEQLLKGHEIHPKAPYGVHLCLECECTEYPNCSRNGYELCTMCMGSTGSHRLSRMLCMTCCFSNPPWNFYCMHDNKDVAKALKKRKKHGQEALEILMDTPRETNLIMFILNDVIFDIPVAKLKGVLNMRLSFIELPLSSREHICVEPIQLKRAMDRGISKVHPTLNPLFPFYDMKWDEIPRRW